MKPSKLKFNLQEIPDGKSTRNVQIVDGELELDEEINLLEAGVQIDFYKTDHFIQTEFSVDALVTLRCDRSLKPFNQEVKGAYQVLYEPDEVEQSETEKGAVRQIPSDELAIDIEKDVRDTIMLALPVRKLHPDFLDSEGNPKEFETQHYGPAPDEEKIDPRWAELKKLKE
ncbi:MAG: DUF177 domain-containing protein [Balneolaceae bacterium]